MYNLISQNRLGILLNLVYATVVSAYLFIGI